MPNATTFNPGPLFEPLRIGGLTLPNRIVMAPMTRNVSNAGIPRQEVTDYYVRRAGGGAGLILTEGVVIDRPAAKNEQNIPEFHGFALDRWREIFSAVHAAGGLIAPQIWHMGWCGYSEDSFQPAPVDSPSGIPAYGTGDVEPMTENMIADTIAAYARAASDAVAIGADAIEIHGAHGYLVDQFFWSHTNRRNDHWGGPTISDRVRFGVEVVRAVRAAIPDDMPLFLRLSQWKIDNYDARIATTPNEMEAWLGPLSEAGADVLHCSQRRFWWPEFEGSDLNFAGWAKKLTGKVTVTVGSVGLHDSDFMEGFAPGGHKASTISWTNLAELTRRIEEEEFDLVAVGRGLIANPGWAALVRSGATNALVPYHASMLETLI